MALTEDLSIFFTDFGVSCTSGAVTGLGILDMPSTIIADGVVLSTDYMLTTRASDFGNLYYGDTITVATEVYQVREVRKLDDGLLVEIALQKLTSIPAPDGADNCTAFQIAMD